MKTNPLSPGSVSESDWISIVRKKVEGLQYGLVQIVVHGNKVTQIDSTEKTRVESSGPDLSPKREPY